MKQPQRLRPKDCFVPSTIRPATAADLPALAHVQVTSWRDVYRGIVADDFLAGMSEETSLARFVPLYGQALDNGALWLVAEDGAGQVLGFAFGGPEREGAAGYSAEVYAIYLLPEAQRQGLGGALLRALARGLAARGHASILVWVLRDNPACRFYEAMGGTLISESSISVGQQTLASRAYGWRPIQNVLAQGGTSTRSSLPEH